MAVVIMGATAFAGCFGAPPPTPQNLKPFATATIGQSVVLTGDSVSFTGQASDPDQGDSIKSWRWDWGDGTNTTGANLTSTAHTYTTHGTYYVNLNVSDTHDATYDTIGTPLRVSVLSNFSDTTPPNTPVASLSLLSDTSVIKPNVGLTWNVRATTAKWNANTRLYGQVLTYAMDYGEGAVETKTQAELTAGTWDGNFSHTYATAGKYVAGVTVTGSAQTVYSGLFRENGATTGGSTLTGGNITLEAGSWNGKLSYTFANETATDASDDFNTFLQVTKTPSETTFLADFGDGNNTTHTLSELTGATWNGKFTHTYATGGMIEVTVSTSVNPVVTGASKWTVIVLSAAPTPGLKNPTTYTHLTFGQPNNLDPAIAYDSASGEVIQNVYETLITYNGASADQFVPLLATEIPTVANGGISADGMNYTFHLKPGVKFHSGDTMDADDVVYSFQRVLRMNWPSSAAWILSQTLNVSGIERVDSMTVTFHLTRAYGPFISTLGYTVACIVSKQTVEAHGSVVDGERNQYMLRNMDGTGPYKFKSWTSGQQVVMERNDAYHRTPARLEAVILRFVNEFSTRMLELKSGNADSVDVNTADQQAALDAAGDANNKIEVLKGASTWSILTGAFNLAINTTHPDREAADNVPSDFFQDPKMREAFVKAFDYQSFITNTVKGNGFRMHGIIPKGMYGYNANLTAGDFNLAEAQAAYDQTRWVTDNSYHPGGKNTGFTLTVAYNTGNTNRQQGCLLLKQGVEQLGPNIVINVKDYAFDVYLDLVFTPTGIPGPIGLFFIGWGPDYADPDDYVVPFAKTGNQYPLYTGFSNASLDALIDQAGSTPNSPARLALYDQIQRSINDNYIYIQVYEATNFRVQKTWVEGWYYNPMQQEDYYAMYKQ